MDGRASVIKGLDGIAMFQSNANNLSTRSTMKQSPDSPPPNSSSTNANTATESGSFFGAATVSLITGTPSSTDLSWRILALVNVFRLLLPLVLGVLFVSMEPRPVGQQHPALFAGVAAGYFLFAVAAISSIRARWPTLVAQAVAQVLVDIVAVGLLIFSNGATGSGFAALLILPVGATALIVPTRLALGLAATAAIMLLAGQILAEALGDKSSGDFTNSGLIGALIFAVT
jgi:hypothetical protein